MIVSIEEFIRTGTFGTARLGMSKAEVIASLGEPEADTDLDSTGCILSYGWYEFYINQENALHSIQNDNYSPNEPETYEFSNGVIVLNSWFLNDTQNQSIIEVEKYLNEKKIKFETVDYYGREVLKSSSGVIVDFDEDKNENGIHELVGLRYWP